MDMDRRSLLGAGGLLALGMASPALGATRQARLTSFTPGQLWLDTSGRPIQAHGGSILQVGKTFYWYGENKERTNGNDGVWHWGVRCYSSVDLCNWEDQGLIIPPAVDDPTSPLHPMMGLDRPHILYHTASRTFVCWLKIMNFKDGSRTRTVLTAPAITGPWRVVKTGLKPFGMKAGDFDLTVSPEDGKAYMYFERMHSEMICPIYRKITPTSPAAIRPI